MAFLTAYATDKGIKKTTNQDALLIKLANSTIGDIAMIAICDGMGGLEKGEVASSSMIQRLSSWMEEELPQILEQTLDGTEICGAMNVVIEGMNHSLAEYGRQQGIELGTTLTAMLVIQDHYYVAHVGDTRLYEIKQDIRQITADQTVVANEIKMGRLTPQAAEADARRSILLQCIGASETVTVDFLSGMIDPEAVYMICCDGFRHELKTEEMFAAFSPQKITNEELMEKQCHSLVELNMQRMEKDNISVVLLRAYQEEYGA